jgi:hypothetical protein
MRGFEMESRKAAEVIVRIPYLRALVAGLIVITCAAPLLGQAAGQKPKRPYLPIRLMNLTTYGDTIKDWLEPGTTNFAQINWRDNQLNRYDFRPEAKPEKFLAEVRASRESLRLKAEQAKRLGMYAYLNEYELNYPDFISRESLLPAEERGKFMEEKVYELFLACPWLDGYMITPTESKLGAASPTELKAVVMGAYRGMKRAEKRLDQKRYLFVRSWLSAASKLAAVKSYFPISTDPEVAKDIIVVAKDGLGDFVMRRPLNPLFGVIQPHAILAEFDVSVSEYRSLGWYPQGPAELWGYRMRQLVSTPGVVGINIHTGRLNEVEGETPETLFPKFKERKILYPFHGGVRWSPWHHLNIYTIYQLLKDPWRPSRRIYENWAGENFGARAAKPMADILLLADDALYHGMLTFGVNLNNHSKFIENPKAPIEGMTKAIKYQIQLQPQLATLFEINSDVADRALAEKDQAIEVVSTMLSILERCEKDFAPDDYRAIKLDLEAMMGAVKGYSYVQAGYFAFQLAVADQPPPHRDYYIERVKDMVSEAEALAVSSPEFLHQKTTFSFVLMTRAYRARLEEKGLWK